MHFLAAWVRECGGCAICARADVRFIVETVLRMPAPLEIPLIAQGVEDAGMIAVLAAVGYSGYQGYAAGKPEPPDGLA